jgi:hypothetical protein
MAGTANGCRSRLCAATSTVSKEALFATADVDIVLTACYKLAADCCRVAGVKDAARRSPAPSFICLPLARAVTGHPLGVGWLAEALILVVGQVLRKNQLWRGRCGRATSPELPSGLDRQPAPIIGTGAGA